MHCYKSFAATTLIAYTIEIMPGIRRKLPLAEIAEWMAQNNIEPEDVLCAKPEILKARLLSLIELNNLQNSSAA